MPPPQSTPQDAAFLHTAERYRRGMQAAFTDLLAGAGLSGARPTEIGRSLGLDKTLAWKLARMVESADAGDVLRHMPGPGGVEIVLKAAGQRRVPRDVLDRVRRSYQDLQEFVAQHAGDRRTFEAMLAGEATDSRAELEERRAYFRSGSALWGARARAQFLMLALKPSLEYPGLIDVTQVSGLVGLERLRADVPWIIRRFRAHSDSGSSVFKVRRVPLVASHAEHRRPPLFDKYCSSPPPALRQFEPAGGWVYDELAPGPVGRAGATTVVLGERYLGAVPMDRSEDNTTGIYALTVRTPVECVVLDLLLHEDLAHFGPPRRVVYGLLEDRPMDWSPAGDAAADEQRAILIPPAPAIALGSPAVVQTPRLPMYPSLVSEALELAGFGSLDAFRGYRAEIEYPPFPCDLRLELDINARRG